MPVILAAMLIALWIHAARAAPEAQPTTRAPVNATCPVTPGEPVDPGFTVEYEGRTIGFCCRRCLTAFSADPTRYVATLDQPRDGSAPSHRHADNGAHTHASSPGSHAASGPVPDAHAHHDAAHASHDHSQHHAQNPPPKLIAWLGKFHPAATHLPIGLLIGAAIAELCLMMTGKSAFRSAVGFCLITGAVAAVLTATLGWFHGGFTLWDADWIQRTHRWLGTATAALSLAAMTLYLRVRAPSPGGSAEIAYRVVLLLAAALVGVTGFFGGALVYGINHYAW